MYMKCGRPTVYTRAEAWYCSIHDEVHKDDGKDVELHEEALNNGEEDRTVAAIVQALRDEVLSNGDE